MINKEIEITRTDFNNITVVTHSVMSQFKAIEMLKQIFTEQFNVTDNKYNKGKITCEIRIPDDYAGIFSFEMERVIDEHNLHDKVNYMEKLK